MHRSRRPCGAFRQHRGRRRRTCRQAAASPSLRNTPGSPPDNGRYSPRRRPSSCGPRSIGSCCRRTRSTADWSMLPQMRLRYVLEAQTDAFQQLCGLFSISPTSAWRCNFERQDSCRAKSVIARVDLLIAAKQKECSSAQQAGQGHFSRDEERAQASCIPAGADAVVGLDGSGSAHRH